MVIIIVVLIVVVGNIIWMMWPITRTLIVFNKLEHEEYFYRTVVNYTIPRYREMFGNKLKIGLDGNIENMQIGLKYKLAISRTKIHESGSKGLNSTYDLFGPQKSRV